MTGAEFLHSCDGRNNIRNQIRRVLWTRRIFVYPYLALTSSMLKYEHLLTYTFNMTYELAIIGGGPAGSAAAVYAARKRITTALITKDFGGQSIVSPDIQNWVGTSSISGNDLAKSFKEHVLAYAADVLTVHEGNNVTSITQGDDKLFTITAGDETYQSKTVLIATGSDRRKMQVPGAAEFEHKGLTYCASCDGPLFADQDVAVIGGGNAGFETAAQLLAYAKSVTLFQRSDEYRADKITVDKVLANDKMTGLTNVDITEVTGDKFVNGLKYTDADGAEHTLDVTGIFVEIGMIPTTGYAADLVELDEYKRIPIDPWTGQTSVPGLWAAGDCTNIKYHQNNIAAGNAVTALEDIYMWLSRE